ncbi:holo-[acyl-carrier-protein] synthase [Aeromicrobium marinum DSM 15272]|uniref:Holo-[acyl-carrier-protein] synthase n=1 Tax=Aeromicrobium marinum DSM 15272 TaxID=585531 RepID=E2SG43_9ACTN|nr:holo-ACP synthase [Aeromicrobium marinum]EFQ81800.1 holo-[acyl-carrier-protein] synthase [Aeromicrobium marinum DSM 15272]
MTRQVRGIGVDVVDLARFAETLERTPGIRERLFTGDERDLPLESLAGRFAAKEALVKALRGSHGLSWTDVEVVVDDRGAPSFRLFGPARDRCDQLGVTALHLSISHDTTVATAFVVAEEG